MYNVTYKIASKNDSLTAVVYTDTYRIPETPIAIFIGESPETIPRTKIANVAPTIQAF